MEFSKNYVQLISILDEPSGSFLVITKYFGGTNSLEHIPKLFIILIYESICLPIKIENKEKTQKFQCIFLN